MNWQPGSTAPKDGRTIIALHDFGVSVMFFGINHPNAPGKKCWRDPHTRHKAGGPVYWMDVPELPDPSPVHEWYEAKMRGEHEPK